MREITEETERNAEPTGIAQAFVEDARPLVRRSDLWVGIALRRDDRGPERELECGLAGVPLPALGLRREQRNGLSQVADRLLVGGALPRLLARAFIAGDR